MKDLCEKQTNGNLLAQAGFTLVELMIAVVIIAVLAAIALPNYSSSVVKSTRSVAKTHLLDIANRQQEYFFNNKTYANDLTDLGYNSASVGIGKNGDLMAANAAKAVYNLSVSSADASSYQLSAVPINGQVKDINDCGTFSLNSRGVRTASGSMGVDCWN